MSRNSANLRLIRLMDLIAAAGLSIYGGTKQHVWTSLLTTCYERLFACLPALPLLLLIHSNIWNCCFIKSLPFYHFYFLFKMFFILLFIYQQSRSPTGDQRHSKVVVNSSTSGRSSGREVVSGMQLIVEWMKKKSRKKVLPLFVLYLLTALKWVPLMV